MSVLISTESSEGRLVGSGSVRALASRPSALTSLGLLSTPSASWPSMRSIALAMPPSAKVSALESTVSCVSVSGAENPAVVPKPSILADGALP